MEKIKKIIVLHNEKSDYLNKCVKRLDDHRIHLFDHVYKEMVENGCNFRTALKIVSKSNDNFSKNVWKSYRKKSKNINRKIKQIKKLSKVV